MKVLAFGEVLFDLIDGGSYIGGAPFNYAANLGRLGIKTALLSAAGADDAGKKIMESAKAFGVDASFIKIHSSLPTGTVSVKLDSSGQPGFVIHENTAWDSIALEDSSKAELYGIHWDVFYFGTLASRSVQNRLLLLELLKNVKRRMVFFDVNLRQNFYTEEIIRESLEYTDILKLNADEKTVLSSMLFGSDLSDEAFCRQLESSWNIAIAVITRGAEGCSVYAEGRLEVYPAVKVKAADTVGAGDAFSAAFTAALLYGAESGAAAVFAGKAAAFTASKSGALPVWPYSLKRAFKKIRKGPEEEVCRNLLNLADSAVSKKVSASAFEDARPFWHFAPMAGWMNDPNGLIRFNGEYHVFFQHNPYGPWWGFMHWGHAVSRDLFYWEQLPSALPPSPEGRDSDGVFSGCALAENYQLKLFYTGVYPEVQLGAVYDEKKGAFIKLKKPLISRRPADGLDGFRDPYIIKHKGEYLMVLGSGLKKEKSGLVLLYASKNLTDWKYRGILFDAGPEYGFNWECPVFFQDSSGGWILIFSSQGEKSRVFAASGSFTADRFVPARISELDDGERFYAPNVMEDAGRKLLFGWIKYSGNNFSGVLSLPRELFLDTEGRVLFRPAEELKELRGRLLFSASGETAAAEVDEELKTEFVFSAGAAAELEYTLVQNNAPVYSFKIKEGFFESCGKNRKLPEAEEGGIQCRVFSDKGIIEIFINDVFVMTDCFFCNGVTAGIKIRAKDSENKSIKAELYALKAFYEMKRN